MKTSTKNEYKCQVELKVELNAEEMKEVVKDVEKAFVREARLPGVRPGKVPVEIIRKQFADGIKQETEHTMIRKHYADAVKAEKLDEITLADVKEISFTADGGTFTAVVEIKPKFKVPTYKGLKIADKDTAVSDEAVKEQLERLRAAYAKYEDAKEGETVADGDFVQIDYTGTVDKKPILEIAPDAKVVASGTGFWTQVEEGRFLPEILDAVKGMKVGETKDDVKAKFAKEGAPEGLGAASSPPMPSSPRRRRPSLLRSFPPRSARRSRSRPSRPRRCAARTRLSNCSSRRPISTFRRARFAARWTATSRSLRSARSTPGSTLPTSRRTATRSSRTPRRLPRSRSASGTFSRRSPRPRTSRPRTRSAARRSSTSSSRT